MVRIKINYVIATYGGSYKRRIKTSGKSYLNKPLVDHLKFLDKCHKQYSQITIMKPDIDHNHIEVPGYYDYKNVISKNLLKKISVVQCPNRWISYGQWILAYKEFFDKFDYMLFTEDDYIIDDIRRIGRKNYPIDGEFKCCYTHRNNKYNHEIYYDMASVSIGMIKCDKLSHTIIDKIDNTKKYDKKKSIKISYYQYVFSIFLCSIGIKITDWAKKCGSIFWRGNEKIYYYGNRKRIIVFPTQLSTMTTKYINKIISDTKDVRFHKYLLTLN